MSPTPSLDIHSTFVCQPSEWWALSIVRYGYYGDLFVLGLQKDILQSSVFGLIKASPSFNPLHFRDAEFSLLQLEGANFMLVFSGFGVWWRGPASKFPDFRVVNNSLFPLVVALFFCWPVPVLQQENSTVHLGITSACVHSSPWQWQRVAGHSVMNCIVSCVNKSQMVGVQMDGCVSLWWEVLRWTEFERADVDVQIFMMQLLATLFVLPVSRRAFRITNMIMMETLWSQLIWLVDWWSGVQVIYSSLPYTEFPQSYDDSHFQSEWGLNWPIYYFTGADLYWCRDMAAHGYYVQLLVLLCYTLEFCTAI